MDIKFKAFLKWAGGKSRISDDIKSHFKDGKRLVEPFVGSGALFLNTSFKEYLLFVVDGTTNAGALELIFNIIL